jgi:dihydroneopterin triphosphate diphosphatase
MARAPFQVIVIPFRIGINERLQYLVLRRSDDDAWQWIAGGGEDTEKPAQAARREAYEEAGIPADARLVRLNSTASIPATHFTDRNLWGSNVYVIPEYSFGIEVKDGDIHLSKEHRRCEWVDYETALDRLKWDSNKTALWELRQRLTTPEIIPERA